MVYLSLFITSQNPEIFHPKSVALLLSNERVAGLSSSLVRASVWTETGKVAVWADEALSLVSNKIDLPATCFPEFESSPIKTVFTSSLYSCVWLENGSLHWWYVSLYLMLYTVPW